ncbi:hypothetical protein PC122_g9840 [Phytophthora cactorum]|nr:hypothetical protein PC122_g9840 [Phytophthora cactorum]
MVSPDDGDEDNTESTGQTTPDETKPPTNSPSSCVHRRPRRLRRNARFALRRLDILKFFKKVEIPPRRDGGKVTRDEIYSDFGHGVRWGRRDMVQAASNKHQEVIWWLYRNTRAPRAMKSVLMVAVYNGDIVLLEWFRAKYRTQGLDPDSEDEDYEVGEEKL